MRRSLSTLSQLMEIDVQVVTWNVGNEEPFWGLHAVHLDELFQQSDVIAIGVQECKYVVGKRRTKDENDAADEDDAPEMDADLDDEQFQAVKKREEAEISAAATKDRHAVTSKSTQKKVGMKVSRRSQFAKLLCGEAKKRKYTEVCCANLAQIRLFVFVSEAIAPRVSQVRLFSEATGILHVYGWLHVWNSLFFVIFVISADTTACRLQVFYKFLRVKPFALLLC
jgi:hypothetical protein